METSLLVPDSAVRMAHRVSAAFGGMQWQRLPEYETDYFLVIRGLMIGWKMREDGLPYALIAARGLSDVGKGFLLTKLGETWFIVRYYEEAAHFMARGLYCLGWNINKNDASRLPPLSAHERLELRLSMPREFWPQAWKDTRL